MIITKFETKILKCLSNKKLSFQILNRKFHKYERFQKTLEDLVTHNYIEQIGGSKNQYGEPIPFFPETTFTLTNLGRSIAESKEWFTWEYIVSHIIIPVVIAIISTLLTLFLTGQRLPFQ